jgi:hypothetical protein
MISLRLTKNEVKVSTARVILFSKLFLVLPYYKGADEIKSQLTKYVDFRFALNAHSTLSRCFGFKEKIDQDMKSKIVYQINCLDCNKFYIIIILFLKTTHECGKCKRP